MLIEWMDIIYLSMIGIIFAFIIHIESELHCIKTMIEEIIKFDDSKKLKNGNGNGKKH
tara:strand:+ start:2327 stop:2500 length:174 start_codon:yes stop_codon:yes gene_type:complete